MAGIAERDKIGQGIHLLPIVTKLRARYYMMNAERFFSSSAFLARVTIALNGLLSLFAPVRTIIAVRSAFPIGMIGTPVPFVPALKRTESACSIASGSVLKRLSALFTDHGGVFSNVLPEPSGSVDVSARGRAEGLFVPFLVKLKTALRAAERWLGVTNSHTFHGAICSLCAWDIGERFSTNRANMFSAGTLSGKSEYLQKALPGAIDTVFAWLCVERFAANGASGIWLCHDDTSDSVIRDMQGGAFSEQRLSVGSKSTLAPRSIIA